KEGGLPRSITSHYTEPFAFLYVEAYIPEGPEALSFPQLGFLAYFSPGIVFLEEAGSPALDVLVEAPIPDHAKAVFLAEILNFYSRFHLARILILRLRKFSRCG